MPYLMISFNGTLTNDIVSFEQLSPDVLGRNKKVMSWILFFIWSYGDI